MLLEKRAQIYCLLTLLCASAVFGQVTTSNVVGVLNDPARAVIPGAQIQLTDESTGAVRKTESLSNGMFRFTNLEPSAYTVSVTAQGFKSYAQKGINLSAGETRDLGNIVLELGAITQEVSVTAQATPVQTASSENSGTVETKQLNEIAVKGRDLFGFIALMPGILRVSAEGETTSPNGLMGVSVNGTQRAANFTVDGVTAMDTGGNRTLHYEPNQDTISEIRVLTSAYSAEYGRNAGGQISVVLKSGSRDFHGSGWWNKRNEALNANDFFKNRTNTPRSPYRYDIYGFTIGGPIYIPKTFNIDKKRLFFFASQEYTKQVPASTPGFYTMPTALERTGDFSQSFDANGKLIVIKDPSTGSPFPQNKIPTPPSQFGLAALNFFPLPNYTDPDPKQLYQRNYKASYTGKYPRRNDLIRVDTYLTSKLNGYFRYIQDYDDLTTPASENGVAFYQLLDIKDNTWKPYTEDHPNPGHGYAVGITYVPTPTIVNEFLFGESFNTWDWYSLYPGQIDRSKLNLPRWYKDRDIPVDGLNYALSIPFLNFGSLPANAALGPLNVSGQGGRPYTNYNNIWSFTDNLSKVLSSHNLKFGLYYEADNKIQQAENPYMGSYSFAHDANWSLANGNTGNGFANAYIGSINSYTEQGRTVGDYWSTNLEWYAQDNWRATKRLTIDMGVRFSYLPPWENRNGQGESRFLSGLYSAAAAVRLYYPYVDANNQKWAWDRAGDPNKLALKNAPLIGTYVPGSGNFANGMSVGEPFYARARTLIAVPRIGFSWDVFGNGKTALRAGFGMFTNREGTQSFLPLAAQPPITFSQTSYYTTFSELAGSTGAVAPVNRLTTAQEVPYDYMMGTSVGIQHSIGFDSVLSVSYVGSFGRRLSWARNINPIPMWSRFDPANTVSGSLLSDNFFRPYLGYGAINDQQNGNSSNYNSLQTTLRRQFSKGLSFGVVYTYSKILATSAASVYFPDHARNYGPGGNDRTHAVSMNYVYQLPKVGARLGIKELGAVTDGWTISGIITFTSGAALLPSVAVQDQDWTGSEETVRWNLVADPILPKSEKTFSRTFNTDAFVLPQACSWTNRTTACFGNAGQGVVRGPGINNWDLTLAKNIPVGLGERRQLRLRAEAYNVWNHTQFSAIDSAATFRGGKQTKATFGSYTATRPPRVMSLSLRFEF